MQFTKIFTTLFLSSTLLIANAQDISIVLKEADRLEAALNEMAAFAKFKEVLKLQPSNLYALSKCSELCSRIGKRQHNTKLRDEYYQAAKIYAQTALKIQPSHSDANCAMAIALGRSSMSKSGKEKIISAKEIKKYVDAALTSNPNNFRALHVLGRWHYEISDLNAIERAAVKVFYGGLPAASIKSAIAAFEKAQVLSGGAFVLNYLELAKAYYRSDDKKKAIATLKAMAGLLNQTEDDASIKEEGKKLLKKWE
jgi:tetratricopeptide (TPR) repeat protein